MDERTVPCEVNTRAERGFGMGFAWRYGAPRGESHGVVGGGFETSRREAEAGPNWAGPNWAGPGRQLKPR